MPYTPQPNAIVQLGGLKAAGVLTLEPGAGFHVQIKGGAVGSLWADTRTTGAASSDYSQFRMKRAGVPKWRVGNNILGLGNDEFIIRRDAEGALADLDVMKVTRSNGRVDFAGSVYSGGVLLGSGGTTNASDLATGTVAVARLGTSGARDATTFLRGDNTWAVPPSGGGGIPTTGGTFTGDVFMRPAGAGVDTIELRTDGRIILRATAAGSTNAAPGIHFRVPVGAAESPDPADEVFYAGLWVTGDRGVRFNYNYKEPADANGTHGNARKIQLLGGYEQDGAWFLRYERPKLDGGGNSIPAGSYDGGGKALSIYPGGFTEGAGPTSGPALRTVDICGMQAGRSIRIGASSTVANPTFSAEFDPNGNVSILRRLALSPSTADNAPLRFNPGVNGNLASYANGDVWNDGISLRMKVGGARYIINMTADP